MERVKPLIRLVSFNEAQVIKATEIAKEASLIGTHSRGVFTLEIESVLASGNTVELFARVFKNGEQVGFGPRGDVDFERFRIVNPPIMVPDGTFVEEVKPHPLDPNLLMDTKTENFKEDPVEAVLQVLDKTLASIDTSKGSRNIILGKHGSTVSTFFPSYDGGPVRSIADPGETWATLKASAGTSVNASGATGYECYTIAATTSNQWRFLGQVLTAFDTSSIPDTDTVTAATYSHYGATADGGKVDSGAGYSLVVVEGTFGGGPIVSGDYELFNTTALSSTLALSSWTDGAYNDFALNASGLAVISKTGTTKLTLLFEQDRSGTPVTWVSAANDGINSSYSEQTGTSQDPQLVVTHSEVIRTSPTLLMMGVG